jgi:ribosomal protein S12 methylthiotransferase accessory factor
MRGDRLVGSALIALDLGSDAGTQLLSALVARHGEAMAHAARLPDRLFVIRSASAPGLWCVGGEVGVRSLPLPLPASATFSLTGTGVALEDALASCLGEGVERLSQVERPSDVASTCSYDQAAQHVMPAARDLIAGLSKIGGPPLSEPQAWVRGRALATREEVLLPADWCLRRQAGGALAVPGAALSTGCAAGPTFEAAAARALLELVERDAASLWWIGGQRPRLVAADSLAMAEAVRLLRALRQGERGRTTWLLDITTDLEIPSVAAVSVDAAGRGFSCGLAARLAPEAAARAAILEMCQMELALPIVEAKRRQRGDEALNAADRRHLARASLIDAGCALLHPLGAPRRGPVPVDAPAQDDLDELKAAFARSGVEAALVDLTRPEFAIPVVHAVAPKLQLMPTDWVGARLQRVRDATGGGELASGGVTLF